MTDIVKEQTVWYPGLDYAPRPGIYDTPARVYTDDKLVELVQKRAEEDGEWTITHGLVGENEELMRKMMEWVSRRDVILQCRESNPDETVDGICRELANAAKQIGGNRG